MSGISGFLLVLLLLLTPAIIATLFELFRNRLNKRAIKQEPQNRSSNTHGLANLRNGRKKKYKQLFFNSESRNKYHKYLASNEWKEIRAKILLRSSGTCEACGIKTAKEVHHRTYDRVGRESFLDLVAVCEDCHHKIHFGPEENTFSIYEYRMSSEIIKTTRDLLFERANHLCEGCGDKQIDDIYNLSGENSSAGILFEMAALCFTCRDRLIKTDNEPLVNEFLFKEYLLSSEWRAKAHKVISRANNICEICAEAPIDDVFHLSYLRAGSEMLFDLAGVCSSCESKLPRIKAPKFFYKEV